MFCIHCGREIPAWAAFCVHCGKPQGRPAAPVPPVQVPGTAPKTACERPESGAAVPEPPASAARAEEPTASAAVKAAEPAGVIVAAPPSPAAEVPAAETAERPAPEFPAGSEPPIPAPHVPGGPYAHPVAMLEKKRGGRLPVILGASIGGAAALAMLIFVLVQFILPVLSGGGENIPAAASESSAAQEPAFPSETPQPTQEPIVEATEAPPAETPAPAMPMEPAVIAAGETHEYDLDGDGVNERIHLAAEPGEYLTSYTLLINDQPAAQGDGFEAELWVVDIDAADRQKELCFSTMQASYTLGAYSLSTWRDGAPLPLADLTSIPILMGRGAVYRKSTQEFPSDRTFTVWADTPVHSPSFGSMYVGIPYTYDGVSVAAAETQVYGLRVDASLAPFYAANTPFKAYAEPGGGLEAFTASVGTVYVPDQLALAGGTLYLHVVSEDGAQSGWISEKSETSAYYAAPPGWGLSVLPPALKQAARK